MKVLILSCNTGQGHNSAALAVAEAFARKGVLYTLLDPLTLGRKHTARAVSATYSGMMKKTPAVFGALYRIGGVYSNAGLPSPVYYANTKYASKLKNYILSQKFTAVVATHLFAMEALTYLQKQPDFTVPCYGVLTDYTCISFFAETRLTGYFLPHKDLINEVVQKGLPADRVFATGMPVSENFYNPISKTAARELLRLKNQKTVLIMCGGVGCGHALQLCKGLLKKAPQLQICVLTGKNRRLKETLDKHFWGDERVLAVPFTKNAYLYMKAADVTVTKPGGLTSSEAAVANVPLVHLLAYAGCETKNAAFFSARGISLRAENVTSAVGCVLALLHSPKRCEDMRAAQQKNFPLHAANEIAERVLQQ